MKVQLVEENGIYFIRVKQGWFSSWEYVSLVHPFNLRCGASILNTSDELEYKYVRNIDHAIAIFEQVQKYAKNKDRGPNIIREYPDPLDYPPDYM